MNGINDIKGFLLDMDGVLYQGGTLIPGAREFVDHLTRQGIPFRFLTNNSQRTRRDVVTKLSRLGVRTTEDHVFTCAMATARFLAEQSPGGTAFTIGEGGLHQALHKNGFSIVDKDPDYVVVGEGRTMNAEMIDAAVRMITNGARLIVTNPDPNCPTDRGLRLGCGAIGTMLEQATGKKAFSPGKPSSVMMRMAKKELGLHSNEIAMVGDTMETDILGAVQMGFKAILVLSGGTQESDIPSFSYKPNIVLKSIKELAEVLFNPGKTHFSFESYSQPQYEVVSK